MTPTIQAVGRMAAFQLWAPRIRRFSFVLSADRSPAA
jgi:hypothetical protein